MSLLAVLISGCAARRLVLPTDPGMPLADFARIHAQLSAACTGVRTLQAELGLSGRAGDQRIRGTVVAGFERPASMRLEAVGLLGQVGFILAARANTATLLFPRQSRILRNASPEAILGALTGVPFAPADLQAILTGCVVPSPRAAAGRVHAGGLASIDVEGEAGDRATPAAATIYLRRVDDEWQLRAARRDGWQLEYPAWQGSFPQSVRLQSDAPDAPVNLTATISQLETNLDIAPAAFVVDAPPDAVAITLEELRQSGPLRGN